MVVILTEFLLLLKLKIFTCKLRYILLKNVYDEIVVNFTKKKHFGEIGKYLVVKKIIKENILGREKDFEGKE